MREPGLLISSAPILVHLAAEHLGDTQGRALYKIEVHSFEVVRVNVIRAMLYGARPSLEASKPLALEAASARYSGAENRLEGGQRGTPKSGPYRLAHYAPTAGSMATSRRRS
jgi:hypothetical protein